jgi:hypothetical protein
VSIRPFWLLRRATKAIALKVPFITVIEYCDDCGIRQPLVWTVSDPLWNEVTGRESVLTDGGGVYCPSCFNRRARANGLLLRWWPVVCQCTKDRVSARSCVHR